MAQVVTRCEVLTKAMELLDVFAVCPVCGTASFAECGACHDAPAIRAVREHSGERDSASNDNMAPASDQKHITLEITRADEFSMPRGGFRCPFENCRAQLATCNDLEEHVVSEFHSDDRCVGPGIVGRVNSPRTLAGAVFLSLLCQGGSQWRIEHRRQKEPRRCALRRLLWAKRLLV